MPDLHEPLIIVTDLDGSLLDHHTYSWQPAQPWLELLKQHHIPLVICSSKTASEIIPLQQALGISGMPFIAENGALVQSEGSDVKPLRQHGRMDYATLCDVLDRLRREYQFHFTGFADLTDKELSEMTGLTPHDASLSRMREASETLVWRDSEAHFVAFQQALEQEGLALTQGGRFWHVMEKGSGKGDALAWLLHQYKARDGKTFITLGLGDGPNDAPMLDKVNFAVVIKGHSNTAVTLSREDKSNVYYTTKMGPEGWVEGLEYFIPHP